MPYISRLLEKQLLRHLGRGKSVLVLGPRQTGKTTLISRCQADLALNLVLPSTRQQYEQNPELLLSEITSAARTAKRRPLVSLDEIQKVPALLSVVQVAIDQGLAQFVLTGSSARKLRRGADVNLLPGRLVTLRLDPLVRLEHTEDDLDRLLADGSLPAIAFTDDPSDRQADLGSYVQTYLEEEIRAEALTRNVGSFGRFLALAGLESGRIVSYRAIAHDLGISHTTVASHFEILEDCLVVDRVMPMSSSATRKKLTKSPKILMFDLGVRRLAANEGRAMHRDRKGELFEHHVGLELLRLARLARDETRLSFWRDPDGPEVDWVLVKGDRLTPIEVKLAARPTPRDARHLQVFLDEHDNAGRGLVICQTPRRYQLLDRVDCVPWQELAVALDET